MAELETSVSTNGATDANERTPEQNGTDNVAATTGENIDPVQMAAKFVAGQWSSRTLCDDTRILLGLQIAIHHKRTSLVSKEQIQCQQ